MTTHTPGPWRWSVDECPDCPLTVSKDSVDGYELIAEVPYKPNARLIAAAPDLVAALDMFVTTFQDFERWPQGKRYFLSDEARAAFPIARAAIAKAKGEVS